MYTRSICPSDIAAITGYDGQSNAPLRLKAHCWLPPTRRICNCRCLYVCLTVCLLATLRKNFRTDLHEIFLEGWQWANEQTITFWWRSGSRIRVRIRDPDRDTGKDCWRSGPLGLVLVLSVSGYFWHSGVTVFVESGKRCICFIVFYVSVIYNYFALQLLRRQQECEVLRWPCMYVCLCVCPLTYLKSDMSKLTQNF